MQIYSSTLKGPLKITGFMDPDDITKISVFWSAQVFSENTVYRLGDVLRPTLDNGYYYQCSINGKTANTEPLWNQEETTSGTAVFTAVPWDLWILPNEYITNSTWACSNTDIQLTNSNYTPETTTVTVSEIPAMLSEFELTNQVSKDNGESLSRTFVYKINQQ